MNSNNIDDLTVGQIRQVHAMTCNSKQSTSDYGFYEIGTNYFVRTVTHHYTGTLIGFDRGGRELIFKNVAWIANDGRFMQALSKGDLNEVEPYPTDVMVSINRESVIDASKWLHELPTLQK